MKRKLLLTTLALTTLLTSLPARQRLEVDDIYFNRSDAKRESIQGKMRNQWKDGARQIIFINDSTGATRPDTVRAVIRDRSGAVLISQEATVPAHPVIVIDPLTQRPAWTYAVWDFAYDTLHLFFDNLLFFAGAFL